MKPKDITIHKNTGIEIASFDYYTGLSIVHQIKMNQTGTFIEVINNKNNFIVLCGDIMMRIDSNDFPTIKRRII